MTGKTICKECGWTGDFGDTFCVEIDTAEKHINVCPECEGINHTLVPLCDEIGCQVETTCGTPTPSGYRNTCSKHRPKGEK